MHGLHREGGELVKLLLDAKVDINVRNNDGWTVLDCFMGTIYTEAVKLLNARANIAAQGKNRSNSIIFTRLGII